MLIQKTFELNLTKLEIHVVQLQLRIEERIRKLEARKRISCDEDDENKLESSFVKMLF